MKVLSEDLKHGAIKLRVESVDDLWVLKNVVREGDVVIARTLRDVKLEGEGKRRLPMTVALKVKKVYFQPFASRLRIHGVILDAPEGYGLRGSHHSLNIDVGSELTIVKEVWPKHLLNLIRRAPGVGVKVMLVAADFDEVAVAVMYRQGIKYVLERELEGVSSEVPDSVGKVLGKVVELVQDAVRREGAGYIVVGAPAFLKDELARALKEGLGRGVKVIPDSVSSGGKAGIHELLRRDSVKSLVQEFSALEAEEILGEVMSYLVRKPQRVALGLKAVENAVRLNAVSKLLVVEDLLPSEEGDVVGEILTEAERRGGRVVIVPRESPAYIKVKNLGGVVATLRYDLSQQLLGSGGEEGENTLGSEEY